MTPLGAGRWRRPRRPSRRRSRTGRDRRPETDDVTTTDKPWIVIVWNDPVNLMSYVVYVFQKLFGYSREKATRLDAPGAPRGQGGRLRRHREKAEADVARLHAPRALGDHGAPVDESDASAGTRRAARLVTLSEPERELLRQLPDELRDAVRIRRPGRRPVRDAPVPARVPRPDRGGRRARVAGPRAPRAAARAPRGARPDRRRRSTRRERRGARCSRRRSRGRRRRVARCPQRRSPRARHAARGHRGHSTSPSSTPTTRRPTGSRCTAWLTYAPGRARRDAARRPARLVSSGPGRATDDARGISGLSRRQDDRGHRSGARDRPRGGAGVRRSGRERRGQRLRREHRRQRPDERGRRRGRRGDHGRRRQRGGGRRLA